MSQISVIPISFKFPYTRTNVRDSLSQVVYASANTEYIKLNIQTWWTDKYLLSWTYPSEWTVEGFNVYRSESQLGPWERVNTQLVTMPLFEDNIPNPRSKYYDSWYRIEAVFPDKRSTITDPISCQNTNTTLVSIRAREMSRRESILLRKFAGTQTLLFKRRYETTRCPVCYDPVTQNVYSDHCHTCFGTGYYGGYWSGFPVWFQYSPATNNTQFTEAGIQQPILIEGWTVSYPEVTDLDLIYRIPDNKMFRVNGVNCTELQTVRVRQICQLTELDKDRVEYNLVRES